MDKKTLATERPELFDQLHPTRNIGLDPNKLTPQSNKKVWWKCPEGPDHEWEAKINNRYHGKGCPVCSNQMIVKSNSLETLNPKLTSYWHPTKNVIKPSEVGPGSNKKVWWKCPKGHDHEWEQKVTHVVKKSSDYCSICTNDIIVESNSLNTLSPEIAALWHPTKNGQLTPKMVHPGAHKNVWWKCPKGPDHEWETKVKNLFDSPGKKKTGCPFCSGQKVSITNCLETVNPEIAKEWDYDKNHPLTPRDVSKRTSKKVWWICSTNSEHKWQTSIANRNRPTGGKCPFCSNKRVDNTNHLKTTHPQIFDEIDLVRNKNIDLTQLIAGSNKKIWWTCSKDKGHTWNSFVYQRTILNQHCPFCKGWWSKKIL